MAGYKEDIDLSLVRNQITLTNNKNAVILKLHDYDYDITAIQYTLFEKNTGQTDRNRNTESAYQK